MSIRHARMPLVGADRRFKKPRLLSPTSNSPCQTQSRTSTPGSYFDELPHDALHAILSQLRLPDVHRLRLALAGTGAASPIAKSLRAAFLARRRDLAHLWTLMDGVHVRETFVHHIPVGWSFFRAADPATPPRCPEALGQFLYHDDGVTGHRALLEGESDDNHDQVATTVPNCTLPDPSDDNQFPLSPTDVVHTLDSISLRCIDTRGAHTIAREFASQIYCLWIYPDDDDTSRPCLTGSRPVLDQNKERDNVNHAQGEVKTGKDTLEGLVRLTKLQELMLHKQGITSLPSNMLAGMKQLRHLSLPDNPRLRQLPHQIGKLLPRLQKISLPGSGVEEIPASLVEVLLRNLRRIGFEDVGIVVSASMPQAVLQRELRAERFPEEAARFNAEGYFPWWHSTIVHIE